MKIFTESEIGEVLKRLYDSEINAKIEWFWGGGFKCTVGDFANGWYNNYDFPEFETLNFRRINEAVSALAFRAADIYPDRDFAKWYIERKAYQELENAVADGRLVFSGLGNGKGILEFKND